MKFGEIVDSMTASALHVAWLRAELEPVSDFGRRAYARLAPYRPGAENEAQQRAEAIAAMARAMQPEQIDAKRDALRSSPDPLPAISRAAMGAVLDDAQLLELMRFLDVAQRVDAARVPLQASELAQALEAGRAGKFGFYLSGKFDSALEQARAAADRAQAQYDSVRGRLAERVADELGRDEIAGGEFIVMRDTVQTLPQGIRVVREAPTYFLCEIELDNATLEALRKRDAANDAVAVAEEAVRGRLSERVRDAVPALESVVTVLSDLDVRLAQARFAQQYMCVPAQVIEAQSISFDEGAYLPLKAELESQGRAYEPISIDLRETAVLTGPNMGGKTVALRTCGFIALLVAFGIPVPARRVQCGLFDEIAWLGIGAQEEAGGLLSSYAREVVRLGELLARRRSHTLLLVDEFARTTTPHEGKALLVALLRGLQRRGRLALVATHLGGIARDAQVRHFAVRGLRDVPQASEGADLNAALAALAKSMDYAIIEVGGEGHRQADAIALAQLLGLDEDIVAEAKEGIWTR